MTIDVVTLTTQTNVTTVITLGSPGPSGATLSGTAGGDLAGTYPSPTVIGLTGTAGDVNATAAGITFAERAFSADGNYLATLDRTTDARPNDFGWTAQRAFPTAVTYTRGAAFDIQAGLGTTASLYGMIRFWAGGPYAFTNGNTLSATISYDQTTFSTQVQAPKFIIGPVTGLVDHSAATDPTSNLPQVAFTYAATNSTITAGTAAPTAAENAGSVYFRSNGSVYSTAGAGVWTTVGTTWAGDLLGSTSLTQIVVALTGASSKVPIAATGASLEWVTGTASPSIVHAAKATNTAPTALTIRAQDAWVSATPSTTKVGGALNLSSGLSYIAESNTDYGAINFQMGGVTTLSISGPDALYWSTTSSPTYYQAQATGTISGKHTTIAAQSGGTTGGNGGDLILDGGAGGTNGTVKIQTGAVTRGIFDDNGLRWTQDVGALSGALVIDVTQRTGTGTNVGYGMSLAAQAGQNQTGVTNNNNGGDITLTPGAAGTGGSGTVAKPGKVIVAGSLSVGLFTQAMADAPQTIAANNSAANLIIATGVNSAVRALTISVAPSSGVMKIVRNNCTVFGITVQFATGAATGTIAPGTSAVVIADGANAVLLMVGT